MFPQAGLSSSAGLPSASISWFRSVRRKIIRGPDAMRLSPLYHSTSRITLRRFIRSRACTTSLLSSTASRRSTVRFASPRYSPKMRLASSTARMMVSWSGLFMTVPNSTKAGIKTGGKFSFQFGAAVLCLGDYRDPSCILSYSRVGLIKPARLGPASHEHGWRRAAPESLIPRHGANSQCRDVNITRSLPLVHESDCRPSGSSAAQSSRSALAWS